MKQSFADSVLYLGGFYPPNRIARQPLIMLHGHRHLEGCREVSPGIYTGGKSLHGGLLYCNLSTSSYVLTLCKIEFMAWQAPKNLSVHATRPHWCAI